MWTLTSPGVRQKLKHDDHALFGTWEGGVERDGLNFGQVESWVRHRSERNAFRYYKQHTKWIPLGEETWL